MGRGERAGEGKEEKKEKRGDRVGKKGDRKKNKRMMGEGKKEDDELLFEARRCELRLYYSLHLSLLVCAG